MTTDNNGSQETEQSTVDIGLPSLRTFVVRKYDPAGKVIEISVDAHRLESSDSGMVSLMDFEPHEPGKPPFVRVHRIFFNVEEVEEVLRMPTRRLLFH